MPLGDELGLPQVPRKAIAAAVVVIAVVFVLGGVLGTVGAGQRGVLLSFQAPTGEIKEEGLYYKIPFVEQVVLMSTQIQKYTAPATSSSKDLQVVTTEVTLTGISFVALPTRKYKPVGLQLSPSSTVLLSGGSERSSPGPESRSSRLVAWSSAAVLAESKRHEIPPCHQQCRIDCPKPQFFPVRRPNSRIVADSESIVRSLQPLGRIVGLPDKCLA